MEIAGSGGIQDLLMAYEALKKQLIIEHTIKEAKEKECKTEEEETRQADLIEMLKHFQI